MRICTDLELYVSHGVLIHTSGFRFSTGSDGTGLAPVSNASSTGSISFVTGSDVSFTGFASVLTGSISDFA